MATLTRDAILLAQDLKTESVDVLEWGGSVIVRSLTGAARDQFAASLIVDGKTDTDGYKVKLIAACLVDDAGNLLFTYADVAVLQGKSAAALDRVFAVADRLNAIGSDAVDAAEKN